MADFVEDYNYLHRHTGIGLNTPADVHYGIAADKAAACSTVLAAARAQNPEPRTQNPERFSTTTDPKILALPSTTWINQSTEIIAIELAT
jgi:putative transposase